MTSQEEYLDKLLKDLTDSDIFENTTEEATVNQEDLMSLLAGSGDDELLEIQDLLQKSDNNDMIDDAMLLPEDISDGIPEELINPDFSTEHQNSTEEKKQQRVDRKEARKAAKDAKRAEKLAQKEAKKAERLAQKESKKTDEGIAFDKVGIDEILDSVSQDGGETKADSGEQNPVEELNLLEEDILASIAALDLFADNKETEMPQDVVAEESGIANIRDISDKTEQAGEDSLAQIMDEEKKTRKKGVFARFMELLMEEDEENEDIPISDENREIINEMDKEGKKKKDRKSKKVKKAETSDGDEVDSERNQKDSKKKAKKPQKEKTPKKEKVENPEDTNSNKKKLPVKSILIISGACLSIGVLIIVCTTVIGDYTVKQAGQKAYYEGDYETCYQNLYGKNLNESEQVMYSKSESILRIRLWIREYELLVSEGLEAEALDSLIQSVYEYPTLYGYASRWNAAGEVSELYNYILSVLSEKYHLTEAQALEIANNPNDVEYTKMVLAIVEGEEFGAWNEQKESDEAGASDGEESKELPDELPEEEGLDESTFVDNI